MDLDWYRLQRRNISRQQKGYLGRAYQSLEDFTNTDFKKILNNANTSEKSTTINNNCAPHSGSGDINYMVPLPKPEEAQQQRQQQQQQQVQVAAESSQSPTLTVPPQLSNHRQQDDTDFSSDHQRKRHASMVIEEDHQRKRSHAMDGDSNTDTSTNTEGSIASGPLGTSDRRRHTYDHIKGAYGCHAMLYAILKKYPYADQELVNNLCVLFLHASGKDDYLRLWVMKPCFGGSALTFERMDKALITTNKNDKKEAKYNITKRMKVSTLELLSSPLSSSLALYFICTLFLFDDILNKKNSMIKSLCFLCIDKYQCCDRYLFLFAANSSVLVANLLRPDVDRSEYQYRK
ncbi:unnamed protein product [Absidia cylindrospora]